MRIVCVYLAALAAFCFAQSATAQERVVKVVTVYTYADGRRVVVEESSEPPRAAVVKVPCEVRPPAKAAPVSPCELCKQRGGCDCTNCACDRMQAIRASGPPAPPVIPPAVPTTVYYLPTYYVPAAQPVQIPRLGAGVGFQLGNFSAEACIGNR